MMLTLFFMIFMICIFAACLKVALFGFKLLFFTSGATLFLLFFIPIFVIGMIVFWGIFLFLIPLLIVGFVISMIIKAIA